MAWFVGRRGAGVALMVLALSSLAGCGTDVAQTAVYVGAPAPLDCSAPSAPPELPADPQFGGDAEITDWVQATGDYGVDQGPGIAVAALDAFRLFVNGHLLATGTDSLVPEFVPLTLLPGDSAIAVVVSASGRAPALLAEVDELERAYGTNASWKVSSDPPDDFSDPSVDASSWGSAVDRGAPAASPGCDPGPGFPAGSDAHFITATTPGTAVFRLDVHIAPVGFAAGTTGGGDVTPVLAATTDEIVNALKSDDPKVVVIPEGMLDVRRTGDDVTQTSACPTPCPDGSDMLTYNLLTGDATCPVDMVPATRDERRIKIGSNTTLVGLARGAALLGGSLDVADSTNVIVRNLALYGVNPGLIEAGDGITIDGGNGVWVDHATFFLVSDGFIDSTTASKNLTFSWIKNDGANPAACFDRHPRSNELDDTNATIHHTLWEHVDGRAPLATHSEARLHLFDNVVTDDRSYGVGAGCGAEVVLEATTFDDVAVPTAKFTCTDSDTLGAIDAASHGNVYGADVGSHQSDNTDAPEPSDSAFTVPYAYTLDPAGTASFIVSEWAGAGARWALPLATP
jgi:pectate lyase